MATLARLPRTPPSHASLARLGAGGKMAQQIIAKHQASRATPDDMKVRRADMHRHALGPRLGRL